MIKQIAIPAFLLVTGLCNAQNYQVQVKKLNYDQYMTELAKYYCKSKKKIETIQNNFDWKTVDVNADDTTYEPGEIKYDPLKTDYYEKHFTGHPFMRQTGFANSMHEDQMASDVSLHEGPLPYNARARYFYVNNGGGRFPGMCPTFAFTDSNTIVAPSFGRKFTTLVLVNTETLNLIDHLTLPGRKLSVFKLIFPKMRKKIFQDTSGGAYFFADNNGRIWIPSSDKNIYVLQTRTSQGKTVINTDSIVKIELGGLTKKGSSKLVFKSKKDKVSAVFPDTNGNIWFTFRSGKVGAVMSKGNKLPIDPATYDVDIFDINADNCMQAAVMKNVLQAERDKIIDWLDQDNPYKQECKVKKYLSQVNKKYRQVSRKGLKKFKEEIQNSFACDNSGNVYIVSNLAAYKFGVQGGTVVSRWDDELYTNVKYYPVPVGENLMTGPVYLNFMGQIPGHVNAGSGTTPTYIPGVGIAIGDNSVPYITMPIIDEDSGQKMCLAFLGDDNDPIVKHSTFNFPFFDAKRVAVNSACENSVSAYNEYICMGNYYGNVDPFRAQQKTEGSIMKLKVKPYDGKEQCLRYYLDDEGSSEKPYDIQTAPPKISIKSGFLYYYNRQCLQPRSDGRCDKNGNWQITAFSLKTDKELFSIRVSMDDKVFNDEKIVDCSTKFKLRRAGFKKNKYVQPNMFSNLGGTFTFGKDHSVFVATVKGFVKIWSQ